LTNLLILAFYLNADSEEETVDETNNDLVEPTTPAPVRKEQTDQSQNLDAYPDESQGVEEVLVLKIDN